METMAAIAQLLLGGHNPKDIISQGYAKSTVYLVQRKLLSTQLPVPGLEPGDEIVELKRYKEKVKLEKEIAELEAAKEKLPERVAALEKRFEGETKGLKEWTRSGVWRMAVLLYHMFGNDNDEAARRAGELVEGLDKDCGLGA